jgi:ATP-dependent DNA ligase
MTGDIHNLDYSERMKFLNKLSNSKHIVKAETKIVDNASDLRKAVRAVSSQEGSEGAYLKLYSFPYELDGKTMLNLKYKNTFSIEAEVQDVHVVKGGRSWNYGCSIKDVNGRDVPIGRTYNTGIKLKVGAIVKVSFCNLNKYFDTKQKKVFYNWWSPRVIMAREDKKRPDNTDTADKLVKASRGEDKDRKSNIKLDADPYMSTPDETKTWLGMLHIHARGKSVHYQRAGRLGGHYTSRKHYQKYRNHTMSL